METVAWIPGWYELDQQLEVGLSAEFLFWRIVPDSLRGPERLVLYNDLWRPEAAMVAKGTIAAIRHPELGAVHKVDTRGLDYTITLANGAEFVVNAEEEPGKVFERDGDQWRESARKVRDWKFIVEFESLSQMKSA